MLSNSNTQYGQIITFKKTHINLTKLKLFQAMQTLRLEKVQQHVYEVGWKRDRSFKKLSSLQTGSTLTP